MVATACPFINSVCPRRLYLWAGDVSRKHYDYPETSQSFLTMAT